jgi:hypothetical protein
MDGVVDFYVVDFLEVRGLGDCVIFCPSICLFEISFIRPFFARILVCFNGNFKTL